MSRRLRLFTPGPLTTDAKVREAMTRDWGSRDADFIALTAELRGRLLGLASGAATHVAVPLQGSGTFILEAAVGTLVGKADKLLVVVNGAYGRRLATIARKLGLAVETLDHADDAPCDLARLAAALDADPAVTHVSLVHVETTTGLLNPLEATARLCAERGRALLVDAMSSFGALPIDLAETPVTAVLASSNKCLEGPPGVGFALVERAALEAAEGRNPSLSLDLHAQWRGFETDGQWRFTPPVQVAAGLVEALRLLDAEGGPPARLARYQRRFDRLAGALEQLGYRLYLNRADQAPIIATFRPRPETSLSPAFDFQALYDRLAARGLVIYPGKLTDEVTFRIGVIGALQEADFDELIAAIAEI
jgi:2-aminoethylphosphonate-pyruvate transaminase